jgi:hypothetical protein
MEFQEAGPTLQAEQMRDDCVKVSLSHNGLEAVCFVSSFHLVEDKRKQLQSALQELLEVAEGV